jgi:hypothetical protein
MMVSMVTSGPGQVIGAGAAGDQRIAAAGGFGKRPLDQLLRFRPAEAHAALGGVHGFGNAEAEIPEPVAEGERAVPVDRRRQPRIVVGKRIGDDVGGGIGDAREVLRLAPGTARSACRSAYRGRSFRRGAG